MIQKRWLWLVALFALVASVPASAQVAVGDKPVFGGKAIGDGRMVRSRDLVGQIVVVHFWGAFSPLSEDAMAPIAEINKTYGDKGVAVIGVTLDRDLQLPPAFMKKNNMTWPNLMTQQPDGSRLSKDWGVTAVPKVFILDPTGTVVFAGHPGTTAFKDKVAEVFEKTPPKLVDDKTLAAGDAALKEVERSLKAKNTVGAFKAMGGVPADAKKDSKFAERLTEMTEKLQTAGKAMLSEADELIEKKDYAAAVSKLKTISRDVPGETAAAAKAKLAELQSDPEVRKAVVLAEKEDVASVELVKAEALRTEGKDELAYKLFKSIAAAYKGTPSGETAQQAVTDYEANKPLMAKMSGNDTDRKAKSMLNLAESYKNAGKFDQAKQKFQQVITEFGGTEYADKAKAALKTL